MTKKILLIMGILVIVGVAAFLFLYSSSEKEGGSRVGFSIREFLPFGRSDDTRTGEITDTETRDDTSNGRLPVSQTDQPVPRLRKISSEPVAGAAVFSMGTTSMVRFVEKGTGNVYEARSDSVAIQRLTNTTIPKIVRAFWLPNGSGFLAQTLVPEGEIIETSFVKLNKNETATTSEVLTPFSTTIGKLPTGIKEITIRPDGAKIFYYTVSDSSDWYVSNPDGTNQTKIISHPLTEWLPKWISSNLIMLQNKSSSESTGYYYSLDVQNKSLKKTGFGINGISFSPNTDGSLALVSSGGIFPRLAVIDNKEMSISDLETATLADKCTWSKDKNSTVYCAVPKFLPAGKYPDVWYKGAVSTEDLLQKIDVGNQVYYNLLDLTSESGEKIDVVDMNISPDETHLVFRNKIDGHLWMLRVKE